MMKTKISSRIKSKVPSTRTPERNQATRRSAAYEILGVKEADVSLVPTITPILNSIPGKISKAVEFLRGSDNPDAKKFLKVYDLLSPTQRSLLPFEAFILASGLTSKKVLGVITEACFEQSSTASSLIAAASHPNVVKVTVASALNPAFGGKDRDMLHKHAGFVPTPKNSTMIVSGQGRVQIGDNQDNSSHLSIGVGELNRIEGGLGRIADRFNTKLGITAGNSPAPPMDTEAIDVDSKSDQPTEGRVTPPEGWEDDD